MDHHGDHDHDNDNGKDVPLNDPKAKEHGEANRNEMDEIPPHGTDPLHEGP